LESQSTPNPTPAADNNSVRNDTAGVVVRPGGER
jgi:hypothetical protein